MMPCALSKPLRVLTGWCAAVCAASAPSASAATTIFQVTAFANPPWSLTYYDGFYGTVGVTPTWPSEMGWQGDRVDIAFNLPAGLPSSAVHYRLRVSVTQHFVQSFNVSILAGPSPAELMAVHSEYVDTARVLVATIPLERFVPGQTNYIRIQGTGVQVGTGQPAGIQWNRWLLTRTDVAGGLDAARLVQLQRLTNYTIAAIQPSGLVRDGLPYSPSTAPFHPATPDAGGFALLGLCVADYFGLAPNAESLAQSILSAYSGHTPGVTPTRNARGHWWHWMNINTGLPEPGWNDNYTTIGSALLVGGALFARNHFIENTQIAALASEIQQTTDFEAAIYAGLDGRVYVSTDANGNALGYVVPWNEYMLIVSLALRQPSHPRAQAIQQRWLNPANVPHIAFHGIVTLSDNAGSFAPDFWVQQQHFFNPDFTSNPAFEAYSLYQQRADALYSAVDLAQTYRYGLTAGVDPTGYFADRIQSHHNVFSPEAAVGWSDTGALLEFLQDQPPASNTRFRYGLTRVSSTNTTWIPSDAALVDHLFLMFGLVESVEPLFFKQRQPFQVDVDADGIADAYDNCPSAWNPRQQDSNDDGVGDACLCGMPFADADGDGDVDLIDFANLQVCPTASGAVDEGCLCFDRDGNHVVDAGDLNGFLSCFETSGPEVPADPNCGP